MRTGELTLAAGDADTAETLARRVLRIDDWSERAYRLLAGVQLAVRRAGLDLDPGWLPWLGCVVAIRYVERWP